MMILYCQCSINSLTIGFLYPLTIHYFIISKKKNIAILLRCENKSKSVDNLNLGIITHNVAVILL